jgi:lipid-binding SYLF domain-containing protein
MHSTTKRQQRGLIALAAGIALSLMPLTSALAYTTDRDREHDTSLDSSVMNTLNQCREISRSCADMTKNVPGILVFPNVVTADLIVGGSGGKGALIENNKITGYYNIGAASAGLQVGIENASQVYVFRTADALDELKRGPDWKAGARAGVTLVTADANATGTTGNVLAYIFDAKGLHAGVALNVFDVWRSDRGRPASDRPLSQNENSSSNPNKED